MWQDLCALLQHPEPIAYALERAHGRHWLPQALQARQEALRKGRANLDTQLDRLTQAYLAAMIPLEEYQRRRRSLEERSQALETQMPQLEAQVDRRAEVVGLVSSIAACCQRVQARLTNAPFEQQRRWVELLIDRVIVTDEAVEIRYVIPTHPRSEHVRSCQLRKDYFHHIVEVAHLTDWRSESPSANCRIVASARRQGGRAGCPCVGNSATKVSSVNNGSTPSASRRYRFPSGKAARATRAVS